LVTIANVVIASFYSIRAGLRIQQIDFHVAFGVNNSATDFIFGVGYSFRFDGLF